jgi:hypothetical protein
MRSRCAGVRYLDGYPISGRRRGDEGAAVRITLEERGRGAGEEREDLLIRLVGEFRMDPDLARLVRTIEHTVRSGAGPLRLLVDASALEETPPSVVYAIRVLDRRARAFDKAVDIRVRC